MFSVLPSNKASVLNDIPIKVIKLNLRGDVTEKKTIDLKVRSQTFPKSLKN